MLRLQNISKKFGSLSVLSQCSVTLGKGDFVVIMGPNGVGKSTLFDIISGKTAPDDGRVYIDGVDVTSHPERKRAQFIGRLHQNTHLGCCPGLTVRENLTLALLKGRKVTLQTGVTSFPQEEVEELFHALHFDTGKFFHVPMGSLSGGQRQTISFLMSLFSSPKILLMDEPTAALDPRSAANLLSFAKKYVDKWKISTLLITHDPQIAKHLGNRLWILEGGALSREFGAEKKEMDPKDFFHAIDFAEL